MMKFEDVVATVTCLKDIYISGRLNLNIANAIADCEDYTQKNLKEYTELAKGQVNESVEELKNMYVEGHLKHLDSSVLYLIEDTSYDEFDEDLMNEMVEDYYGGIDSLGFASCYEHFGKDFNNLLQEFTEVA